MKENEENHRNHDENHKSHNRCCHACATDHGEESPHQKQKSIIIIVTSGLLLLIGLYFELLSDQYKLAQLIFLVVVLIAGYGIIKRGIKSVIRKRFDMNFLITIAAVGAFLIGHGEEGAAVVFLFYLAEFLEDYAADRSKRSIEALLKLAPEVAKVKRDGSEVEVHVTEVGVGETVVVRPGEKIPLDGVVSKGSSSVNQAPITGESVPAFKKEGSAVYAGTINEDGFLEIQVTKKSTETMVSKIARMVEEAQMKKSKTERFVERFARYYTPAVIFLAAGTATIPVIVFDQPFSEWFYRALVLLVVSCPCALTISTPVSMVSGITSAARNGVLIKGGDYIEEVGKAKTFVFDKTGTLTMGELEVTDIELLNNNSRRKLLEVCASLESLSQHPLAKAVMKKAVEEGIKPVEVKEFRAIAGRGVMGKLNGETYYIGSKKMFRELGIPYPKEKAWKAEEEGKTVILVGKDGEAIGMVSLIDKIRDSAAEVISALKKRGIETVMLTGDNERTAKAIAKKIGIDHFHAGLLPDDKVDEVERLKARYGEVVMIGDGVNDAPALARANVGIAMGAIGSDIAIESADIALMQDDISKTVYLLELSKKTLSVVKQNIIASIGIKGSFAILAFPGIVTLWMAVGIGDMGLSLAVILNALRLGRVG